MKPTSKTDYVLPAGGWVNGIYEPAGKVLSLTADEAKYLVLAGTVVADVPKPVPSRRKRSR
ncbi:Uncharacterised protein [Starkeya nomas]|uniref:Uncharacterized protein n=1 Tax=Starkeya nomas TaxID=2666134 RepID=A0A5S9R6G3_9HYPH|nr:hypothetical protein [Starkeya nomas]CAA0129484.1 Uncharacterised protein [Starkeya nomas]